MDRRVVAFCTEKKELLEKEGVVEIRHIRCVQIYKGSRMWEYPDCSLQLYDWALSVMDSASRVDISYTYPGWLTVGYF
jgi:hypothetical protein